MPLPAVQGETKKNVLLSILIPVYNGEKTITPLVELVIDQIGKTYQLEIVLVNDGSKDKSEKVCKRLVERFPETVRFFSLSRNFGEHNAVMAGLGKVRGTYTVIIDDDFQNPPTEIEKLVHEITKGYDVVYSYYDEKKHSLFRNWGSKFNCLCANILLKKPPNLYLSSFKILNRFIVDQITAYDGPHPYIDGLILRVTANIGQVKTDHAQRKTGKSNYTIGKLALLWMNMFANFSILPLRFAIYCGFLFHALSLVMVVIFIIERIVIADLPAGWTTIVILLTFFMGLQLLITGMVGEYVGRILLYQNRTPQFIIRNTWENTGNEIFEKPTPETRVINE